MLFLWRVISAITLHHQALSGEACDRRRTRWHTPRLPKGEGVRFIARLESIFCIFFFSSQQSYISAHKKRNVKVLPRCKKPLS